MTAPTSITARIASALGDAPWSPVAGAVAAVLELHRPLRIYDDCGHKPHDYAADGSVPDGLHEIQEIGLVCEEGYQFTICHACCTWDDYQSEWCDSAHDQLGVQVQFNSAGQLEYRGACWPCPTVRAIAEALGVQP